MKNSSKKQLHVDMLNALLLGKPEQVRALLDAGADPNHTYIDSFYRRDSTYLRACLDMKDAQCAEVLVTHPNNRGERASMQGMWSHFVFSNLQHLFKVASQFNTLNDYERESAILQALAHQSVEGRAFEWIKLLLEDAPPGFVLPISATFQIITNAFQGKHGVHGFVGPAPVFNEDYRAATSMLLDAGVLSPCPPESDALWDKLVKPVSFKGTPEENKAHMVWGSLCKMLDEGMGSDTLRDHLITPVMFDWVELLALPRNQVERGAQLWGYADAHAWCSLLHHRELERQVPSAPSRAGIRL